MAAILPFGEYRPDVSDLMTKYVRRLRNVLPRSDGYGPFRGIEPFTQALPGECRGAYVAFQEDGAATVFGATETDLYVLNNTTLAWSLASKGATSYASLDAEANWTFAQFNNFVIAANRNDVLQVFDITSDTEFDDLGGTPPQAGWVTVIGRFLVLADLLDDPFRVQWSGLNAVTTWDGTNNSDYQDLPDYGRAYAVREVAGDVGIIFQADGCRRMVFAPGSEEVFQIDRLPACPGIRAPYSLAITSGSAYYLSTKGFAQIDANGGYAAIGEERVDRTILGLHDDTVPSDVRALAYDTSTPRYVVGVADPSKSLILWGYRSAGSSAERMDRGLAYHTTLKRWSPVEIAGEFMAPVVRPGLTLEGLDAVAPGALSVTGAANNGSGLIRITVASTASLTTGNVKTLSDVGGVSAANGTWTITVIDGTHFDLQGSTFSGTYTSGGVVAGSLDDLPFSLDNVTTASLPSVAAFDADHELGFFSGATLEAELHTSEQGLDKGYRIDINNLRPITDAEAGYCSVVKRERLQGSDEEEGDESAIDTDGNCPVLENTRYGRGKLRIPAETAWTFASGIEPDVVKSGMF